MRVVYRAANLADAHLIRQMLDADGIPAFVQGEYLQGAVGELPANTEIFVWVADEHGDAARAIVDEWEKAAPIEFETDELRINDLEANASERSPKPRAQTGAKTAAHGFSAFWVAGALIVGGSLGAAATWAALHAPQSPSEIDFDGDGRADEFAHYYGERLEKVEQDRNRDGKIDRTFFYDANGSASRSEDDDDFDGRIDDRSRYRDGLIEETEVDFDGDGRAEYRAEYRHDLIAREEFMSADGIPVKRVEYKHGWPERGEFDSDGDGRMDTARRYDRHGEVVASEPLAAK